LFRVSSAAIIHSEPEQIRARVEPYIKDPKEFFEKLDAVYGDPLLALEDEIELTSPKRRILRRHTAPVTDERGQVIGRLWTFLDITEMRLLEQRVRDQAERLRAKSQQLTHTLKSVSSRLAKAEKTLTTAEEKRYQDERLSAVGLLAATVAHDIRNILTPLAIEISLADDDDPGEREHALNAIRHQLGLLSGLTGRLLTLANPTSTERGMVDVGEVVSKAAELVTAQALKSRIAIAVAGPKKPVEIMADAVQVEQVVSNLLMNAIQAMRGAGGRVHIRLRRQYQVGRKGVSLIFVDNGPGIPAHFRKHLFDPFVSTKPDGCGLGLLSCKRIVESHGGSLGIRSGKSGTRVFIWLPADGRPSEVS
jgi:signal transduction histidine kinase